MPHPDLSRRALLRGGVVAGSALTLSGCDAFDFLGQRDNGVRGFMERTANGLSYRVQRFMIGGTSLAQEFTQADIRQPMRPNGITAPENADYKALAAGDFADWRLTIGGMVDNPQSLTLAQLMAMPARTQITRHDCVEGWSCIAKWTGTPLGAVLDMARPKQDARFVVFKCLDVVEQGLSGEVRYYESIDLVDARHPQTILAYAMNDQRLPTENGAPLRVRIERQLGYKMAKYVTGIELVADLKPFGLGKGGYWEDRGYEWYAGI